MASLADLQAAKKELGAFWLPRGRRAHVVTMKATPRVADAAGRAGQAVHAVGVGYKRVNGKPTQTRCVQIYVLQKLPKCLLAERDQLPARLDGIPVDVVESQPAFMSASPRRARHHRAKPLVVASAGERILATCAARVRPVRPGISAGHHAVTFGTIGALCRTIDGAGGGGVCILGNNHVFANANTGSLGDDVQQPAPADCGTIGDRVADLLRWVPLDFSGGSNRVDCAIAALAPGIHFRNQVPFIGRINGTVPAMLGMLVAKHGRTTGFTIGQVTSVTHDVDVGYAQGTATWIAHFENQVRIERISPFPAFARRGDSGAVVVESVEATLAPAVGLYFAGPDDGSYGVANPMAAVLEALQITLL
jgi:hypothetical protein